MIHTPFLRQLKHNGLKCKREETLRRERKYGQKIRHFKNSMPYQTKNMLSFNIYS